MKVQTDGVLRYGWHYIDVKHIEELFVRVGYLVYHIQKSADNEWKTVCTVRITNANIRNYLPYYYDSKTGNTIYEDPTPVSVIVMYTRYNQVIVANPILNTFPGVVKSIPADVAYNEIYNFISAQFDKDIIDNRTDVEKLQSAGFDKVTSFRNIK